MNATLPEYVRTLGLRTLSMLGAIQQLGEARLYWLLVTVLFFAMLIPVWQGPYPSLYDYPNHLLEAQVVAHYTDPAFGYADSYHIRSDWYLRSNALSTALLIALMKVMPATLAGRVVVSLYFVLFAGGLGILFRSARIAWPLLFLAPILANNMIFTAGMLNFSYASALGLYALAIYLRWREEERQRTVILLAGVVFLMYVAHLLVWIVCLVAIAAMAAADGVHLLRQRALLLTFGGAMPLLLVTRPMLAVWTILSVVLVWTGIILLQRLRLSVPHFLFGTVGITGLVTVGVTQQAMPLYQLLFPNAGYSLTQKAVSPLRLFTLPHQFAQPDMLIITYNLVLLLSILALGGIIVWSTIASPLKFKGHWIVAIATLSAIYVIVPSRNFELTVIEPRILLFIVFLFLIGVRLPVRGSPLWFGTLAITVSLCVLSVATMTYHARVYNLQARAWERQMETLVPAQSVLVLPLPRTVANSQSIAIRAFNVFYDGQNFSTMYALKHGGFVSRAFDNGPIYPHERFPTPRYYWTDFDYTEYIADRCTELRRSYDGVLTWGLPDMDLSTRLDACFRPGPRLEDVAIWWTR